MGGWDLTKYGKRNGGFEMEGQNGSPYVIWDKSILLNKSVLSSIDAATGKSYENGSTGNETIFKTDEFRKKHEAKYRNSRRIQSSQ